jgi:hypothetical protein
MSRYEGMGPSKGASRPSSLAVNPNNEADSAARRARLLEAFDSLSPDQRADLLELAETWAFRATRAANTESRDARDLFREMYAAAGWDS